MLVCMGSAMFTVISLNLLGGLEGLPDTASDPLRMVSGIISGIGFLGAGAILREDGYVHGITTAATVWVVGALGVACGLGLYKIAVVGTAFALTILLVIGVLESKVRPLLSGDDEVEKPGK